jgi:hypothetical protein
MKFDLGKRSYFSQFCGGYTSHWRHSSGKDNWKNGWDAGNSWDPLPSHYKTDEAVLTLEEEEEYNRVFTETCDWCHEYTDCTIMEDSSTACLDCAEEIRGYLAGKEVKQ